MNTEPAWDYRRDFRHSPYVVYDDTDEVYLSDETWQDDLWDARRFHSFEEAHAEAQKHGGAENSVYAYSFAVCENGYLIRLAVEQVREADARQALAHAAVGEGYAVVPRDATREMLDAAFNVDWSNEDEAAAAHNIWNAMVAASPLQSAGER